MSIQLGVGPHSTASLIRSDSSFQANSIQLNNITVSNTITTNSLNISSNVNIINDLNISGNLNATNTDLTITNGSLNLYNTDIILGQSSNINFTSDLSVNNLNITNQLSTGNLTVTSNSLFSNDVIISGDLTVNGMNLYVNNSKVGIGTTSPTEALEVSGSSKINNNLEVRGSMVIGGEDNFNDTNFEDFSKWGSGIDVDTQIYSKYEYVGIGTQNPQYFLDVSGIINTKDRYFLKGVDVLNNNTLGIGITNSNLENLGTLNSLNVTGQSHFLNDLNISSNMNISGDINLSGNLNNTGNLNITGIVNINDNLKIGDNFDVNNTRLNISQNINLINNDLKISKIIYNTSKRLPPTRLSGNQQDIDYFYGSGQYEITSSSISNSLFAYQCLDQYTDTFFRSDVKYNYITGLYEGTTNFNNLGILGEWLKIRLPESYILNSMTIKVLNRFIFGKNPKEIHIYGSNDDNTWSQIQVFQNLTWSIIPNISLYTYQNFVITNTTSYKYYTFIINKVGGTDLSGTYTNSDSFALGELELFFDINEFDYYNFYSNGENMGIGTTNPNHTLDVKGNLNINGKFLIDDEEIFNTSLVSNLREYPPQKINIKSLKINTKLETVETGIISEDEVTYGDGIYEIYYTGFSPFLFPNSIGNNVFNKILDQNIYYRTADNYDASGDYIGNKSLNSIPGEYIIIKLPQNILIQAFRIYSNLYDSEYFSPKSYKILGSLNKTSWDILFEKDDEYFSTNGYGFIERNIDTSIFYKYFALVVSKVGNYDINFLGSKRALKIQEFKLFGVQYNDYGVNYSTGIYIDGPLAVNGDLDINGQTQLGTTALVDTMNADNINSSYIYTSNLIGLGVTQNLNGKLEISGESGLVELTNSYIKMDITEVGLSPASNNQYSIYADGKIASSEFNAISDKRVKNILNERNFKNDKLFIENVNIYDFEYIDKLTYGNKQKIGFMAQDLERLNNNLVNYSTNFIPNVFKKFKIINKQKVILDTDYDIQVNDILKIEVNENMKQIKILEKRENYIILEKINNLIGNEIFIYGKQVNDFKTINFEQLIAINMNSIKNLYNEIKEIKENQKTILNHLNIN